MTNHDSESIKLTGHRTADAETGSPQARIYEAIKQIEIAATDERLKHVHQSELHRIEFNLESLAKYAPATERDQNE